METGKEVQEEIMFEQEFPSLGKKRSDSEEENEEGERTDREGRHTKQKQLHWKDKEAGKDIHIWFVQRIFKGAKSQRNLE